MPLNYFISGATMLLIIMLVKSFIGSSIIELSLLILTGCIVYVGMLFVLKDKFFLGLFNQGIDIVKRQFSKTILKLKKS